LEKIKFLIIPVMFIYFLVQNDNYSPQKYKAFALTGRQACIHYFPGRCPGLGASALSGRVGKYLRKFSIVMERRERGYKNKKETLSQGSLF
jgi:hypothetical protein